MSILKFARHPAALFGLTVVLIAWTGAFVQLQKDRSDIERAAIDRGIAAAQLFGTFSGNGALDGVARLVAYRTIPEIRAHHCSRDSTDHIFEPYEQRKIVYLAIAALVTLLALVFVLLIRRRHAALEHANNLFPPRCAIWRTD